MFSIVSLCAICLIIKAALGMEEINFDLLVENLTIYNGTVLFCVLFLITDEYLFILESDNYFLRNRNFMDFLKPSASNDFEMWMALVGVFLFTVLFSTLIIFGAILTNESILRR